MKKNANSDSKTINILLDRKGIVISINAAGTKILGLAENEIIGKTWFEYFIPKETISEMSDAFKIIFKKRLNSVYTGPIINSAGETKNILWENSFIEGKTVKTAELSLVGHEIKSEQQLYSLLFNALSESKNIENFKPLMDKYQNDNTLSLKDFCLTNPKTKKSFTRVIAKLLSESIIKKQNKSAMLFEKRINLSIARFSDMCVSSDRISVTGISDLIIKEAEEITQSELGFAGYIDKSADHVVASSFTKAIWNQCETRDKFKVLKNFCDSWEWVLKAKEPIIRNNLKNDKRLTDNIKSPVKTRSFVSATSPINNNLTAIVVLANSSRTYTNRDLEYVKTLANFYAITMQRKTEEDQLSEYKTIVNASSDLIFSMDKDGIIRFVNRKIKKYGYETKHITGKPLSDFCHPEDKEKLHAALKKAFKTGKSEKLPVFRIKKRNGTYFYAKQKSGIIFKNGKPKLILATTADTTKFKSLQNELFQSKKMDAINKLARGVAHDFNNVLGAIEGYTSIIMTSIEKNNPINEDLAEIKKTVTMATNITKQLLAFSRKDIHLNEVANPNEILNSLSSLLEKFGEENIKLKLQLGKNLPNVTIDRTKMEQAMINLAINARDAIKEANRPGIINIKTSAAYSENNSKKMVKISIADNGAGIKKENIQNIFEPLFTTKPKGQGTGLGLSTVYHIIKQHNGHIEVSSKATKKTMFNIYLPATNTKSIKKIKGIPNDDNAKEKNITKRILLIEDDENLRKTTSKTLEFNGFKTFSCANCKEAERTFDEKNGDFDIIFSDVILPDGNGIELAEKLFKTNSAMGIVIASGYLDKISEAEKTIHGKHKFIQKPYKQEFLLKVLNNFDKKIRHIKKNRLEKIQIKPLISSHKR